MAKTTSLDDPHPPPPATHEKRTNLRKIFTSLISGMGGEEYRVALHYHCPEQEPITRLLSRIIVGTFFQWQLLKSPPWPLRLHLGLSRFCSEKAKKLLRNMPKSCSKVAQN